MASPQRRAIEEKRLELRLSLWPKLNVNDLWNKKKNQGFTNVPRTIPIILKIMDSMSKGRPVSSVYLDLWCRSFDESFITLNKSKEMAFSSGYTGQRAEKTWEDRLKILAKLKFIDLKSGPHGVCSYALIWNPYLVIKNHYKEKKDGLTEDLYNALLARSVEIGARDLLSRENSE
ncbi:MAG: hypothetical protein P9L94_13990 [Candidatus Hinthialibacter antarcticus]|nr:hypothetical protein [Candidatus Hinthialibacter antarcticus]